MVDLIKTDKRTGKNKKELKVRLLRMNLRTHPVLKTIKKEKPQIKRERKLRVRLLKMKSELNQVKNKTKEEPNIPILRSRSDRKVDLKYPLRTFYNPLKSSLSLCMRFY